MDCPHCAAAEKRQHHGSNSSCPGCRARAAARSPQFFKVRQAGVQDRHYRAMLAQMQTTHEQVKEAAGRDAITKERA